MPNIEIKAHCPDLQEARKIAQQIKTDYLGILKQTDTYYFTQKGRLKLREINESEAQLIPYFKDYSHGPMKSSYVVLPVKDIAETKKVLAHTLGVQTVVQKSRELFLIDNVRVHLDSVAELGDFIEFEAVYTENSSKDKKREENKLHELMKRFSINQSDLLDQSYIDYLLYKRLNAKSELLFAYENDHFIVFELKRTDLPDSASKARRFGWYSFKLADKSLQRLHFLAMEESSDHVLREFKEAQLKSDEDKAIFKIECEEHSLVKRTAQRLPKELVELLICSLY